jgi:hypothetical protein
MDWLNLPTGVVVVAVVLMALFMFWGGEQLERIFGKRDLAKEPRLRIAGAGALFVGAVAVLMIGAPTNAAKYARVADQKEALLSGRQVQVHPGELLTSLADDRLRIVMLDVRPEQDFNLFHLEGARRVTLEEVAGLPSELLAQYAPNVVYVVMSNDEAAATQAWRTLVAESVPNVYILEGGVNNWLSVFAADEPEVTPTQMPPGQDRLAFSFPAALGARYEAAFPNPHAWELEFTPRIKLELKRDKSGGGCG